MTGPLTPRSATRAFAIGTLFLLAFFLVFASYTVSRVKDRFYFERIRAREMMINVLAGGAKIPLLADDSLSLHSLVEEAAQTEELVYAVILDAARRVKATADPSRHPGILREIPTGLSSILGGDRILTATDVLPSGTHVLRFSRSVMFTNTTIGYVVLGFSKDAIDERVGREGRFLWIAFAVLGLCAVAMVCGMSILLLGRGNLAAWGTADAAGRRDVLKTLPDSDLERSHLTVLFAGVKGFKKYADSKEPGQVIRDMNGYLAVATEKITKFGGEVDKFVGDAVVAVFRSSVHQPDHIERAVRSAAAIQKALQQEGGDGNPLYATIGIGISSGVALSGRLAVGEYSEPLYIGESFKSAYLLHVMADPGEIIISRDIYQVMEKSLSVEPLPPREMMERTEPWENFRLLRVLDEQEIHV